MTRRRARVPVNPLLSVVMPAYNERDTIEEIVLRVLTVPLYDEGRKITWRDGVAAVRTLLKYRFTE